jgi:septum site-determining protein MinD
MRRLVDEMKADFDYVIIDCPAGIEQGFKNSIAGADRALIVTTPEVSAIRDADRIIGLVEAHELPEPELIINRYRPGMVSRGDMMSREDILEILAIPLIGLIPDHEDIITSTNRGQPAAFDDHSVVGAAYRRIARRVQGEQIPIPEGVCRVQGFYGNRTVEDILRQVFRATSMVSRVEAQYAETPHGLRTNVYVHLRRESK